MIYRLLGELEIGEGSRLLHLPGGPTLVVLAALLVNANRRMSKAELIRVAWGGDDVEEAQLYKRVKAVRDLLAEMGHGDHLKTHPRFGYEMRVAEDDVDHTRRKARFLTDCCCLDRTGPTASTRGTGRNYWDS